MQSHIPVPDQEEVPPYTSIESNQQLIPMTTYRADNKRHSNESSVVVVGSILQRNENESIQDNENENISDNEEQSELQKKLQHQMMVTPQVSSKKY